MPARTGAEYLDGLKRQEREIWMDGRRVEDVTEFPGLANGAKSIAQLYDMQHNGAADCAMTYPSPSTGDPVGLSFIIPKTSGGSGAATGNDVPVGPRQLRDDGADARTS